VHLSVPNSRSQTIFLDLVPDGGLRMLDACAGDDPARRGGSGMPSEASFLIGTGSG